MSKRYLFLLLSAWGVFLETSASAQQVTMDMWTSEARRLGAYTTHTNNCSGTEVFVPIGGSSRGFCMEMTTRTSATWDDAREVCIAAGGRLPEPMEFKFACKNPPSGLINMTSGPQWASNQATLIITGIPQYTLVAALMGNGSCVYGDWALIAASYSADNSFPYRCVK